MSGSAPSDLPRDDREKKIREIARILHQRFGDRYLLGSYVFGGHAHYQLHDKHRCDAAFVLHFVNHPEAMLDLVSENDVEQIFAIGDAVAKLRKAVNLLSPMALHEVKLTELMHTFSAKNPDGLQILDVDALDLLANSIKVSQKNIAKAMKRGRSDKRWDSYCIEDICRSIWTRQTGSPPSIFDTHPEASPYGSFVCDIFDAVGIEVSVKALFVRIVEGKGPDLTDAPMLKGFRS